MKIEKLKDATKKYDIIYADPAWSYKDKKNNDPAMGGITYDVMELDDIKAMGEDIKNITNKDSLLFLWVTMPMLREGLEVIEAWGYKYITCAFTWVKLTPSKTVGGPYGTSQGRDLVMFNGNGQDLHVAHLGENQLDGHGLDIYSGLGHWTNGNAELCLLAKKGKGVKRVNKNVKQVVLAPRKEHSEKPLEVRERIERLVGDGEEKTYNKLELFCRGKSGDTWDDWGNEAE
jgi:site-specific DNA-methyltransferase (adenine-specific)